MKILQKTTENGNFLFEILKFSLTKFRGGGKMRVIISRVERRDKGLSCVCKEGSKKV